MTSLKNPSRVPLSSLSASITMSLQDPILSILPHEIVIKILSLLSLESLFRLRWASKSWLHLITHHSPNNSFHPPPVVGYYFQYNTCYYPYRLTTDYVDVDDTIEDVDADLSFLPRHPSFYEPAILDSCNGLVLCTPDPRPSYGTRVLYVCNPVTKSWITLPDQFKPRLGGSPYLPRKGPSFLGFKPWVSPYYYVLSTESGPSGRGGWSMYSSKTKRWSKRRTLGGDHIWPYDKNDVSIWNGDAYVIQRRQEKLKVCIETVRFCLAKGKEENIKFPEIADKLIKYPNSKIQPETYIGKLGGELCFVHLHGLGLTVWSLGRGDEWVLKHASNIEGLQHLDPEPVTANTFYGILTFNPMAKVVLVLHKGTVYSYDLDRMALEEVYYGLVGFDRAFPFSPCLFDVFPDGDANNIQ